MNLSNAGMQDDDAMKLGEELGQKFYRYEVKAMGSINIIDLKNLVGISEHLRKENVRWINSIGFFMEYLVEKGGSVNMTHEDKGKVFASYCRGGVEHITFSAYQDHPLPRFVLDAGWKGFELDWTQDSIISTLKGAGYSLVSIDNEQLPIMQVYYFRGECK